MQAEGISSANTVGYSGHSVNAKQFYMVGVQFSETGVKTERTDFNKLLSTTCAPGVYGDGITDPTYGNAPVIQVPTTDGKGYSFYYYVEDAWDDAANDYVATAWVDLYGNNLTADDVLALSKGFWFKSETGGTLNCAGQVSTLSTFTRNIPAKQFEIVANPYPIALNLNTPTVSGFAPGLYGDGITDPTYGNAPMIQVPTADGKGYSFYYYVKDAWDDTANDYVATAWVDLYGNNLTGTQVGVGQSFWINTKTAGTFTFELN